MKTIRIGKWAKYWCLDEKFHREDGPAVEWFSGDTQWYLNGKLHREDGPAYENTYGDKEWFLNGKEYTKEEFHENNKTRQLG